MTETKSILNLLKMQWQKVKELLTYNWKPKYLCLFAASVVWGAVFFATERDNTSMSNWGSLEETPKNPTSGGNTQIPDIQSHPTEPKPIQVETK